MQGNDDTIAGVYVGVDATGMAAAGDGIGIVVTGDGNTIGGTATGARNLISASASVNFGEGVEILGTGATGDVVQGNFIGTNVTGTAALGNGGDGVLIFTSGNTIGGTATGAGNLISGNSEDGLGIAAGAIDNLVAGNFIGTDAAGTGALGNAARGVDINSSGNTIGGTAAGAGNLISGNTVYGIDISGAGTTGNLVAGNLIGTDAAGTAAIANGAGIQIDNSASGTTVGGLTSAARNVISGNQGEGIVLFSPGNTVVGNYVGTTDTGNASLPNFHGIHIGWSDNTIGGTAVGAGNVIAGNVGGGLIGAQLVIEAGGTDEGNDNLVEGNDIGVGADGNAVAGETGAGVELLDGTGNTIGGLTAAASNVISGNENGVVIFTASGNVIEGDAIGTDATGTVAIGNGNNGDGIEITEGSTDNTIGGSAVGEGNLISGNAGDGIMIQMASTTDNLIVGNLIGTDITGTLALPNATGVDIVGAPDNTIGGSVSGDSNLISGNTGDGIYLYGSGTTGTIVVGNRIGTDADGTAALSNSVGVEIDLAASNTIGGDTPGDGNLISGNQGEGIEIAGAGTNSNVVLGNLIGTDAAGTASLANIVGVAIEAGASDNTIGGTTAGAGNVISGNTGEGVQIFGAATTGNLVVGNRIGTDFIGTVAVENGDNGIVIFQGASANTIGGTAAGAGNVISGNFDFGVQIYDATSGNLLEGNKIGTDITGTLDLPNNTGVMLESGPSGETIGGTAAGAGNLISGNTQYGVEINGGTTSANLLLGNLIGTDITGTVAVPNGADGVFIVSGTTANTIGGTAAGAGNVISSNTGAGVDIEGAGTSANLVLGNKIGTDITGTRALGNDPDGVSIFDASGNTIGGTAAGAGNLISGNTTGIEIHNPGASGNFVLGNQIGTDVTGTLALPDATGIYLIDAPGNMIGGSASGDSNLISGDSVYGIEIYGSGASGTIIAGNRIGTDITGTLAVPDGAGIYVENAPNNTIGGSAPGDSNLISGNAFRGIELSGGGTTGTIIVGNLIGTDITGTRAAQQQRHRHRGRARQHDRRHRLPRLQPRLGKHR